MRLIDADALKEALKKPILMDNEKANRIWEGWHECTIAVDEAINAQPTIEPEQTWIPCSESVPKLGKNLLVTTSWNFVTKAMFCGNHWEIDSMDYKLSAVVAWMPLPKPWKGESNDRT